MSSGSSTRRWAEEVSVGDPLPSQVLRPDAVRLFLFSAATHNPHRIHYDLAWAREGEGHDGLVVHGPLLTALAVGMVTDWVGPDGVLMAYDVQNRGSAFVGEELTAEGRVSTVDADGLVELALTVSRGGEVLVSGTAAVRLPARGGVAAP